MEPIKTTTMENTEDNRIVCKYGLSCYQKNPSHHEKYKHPEKRKRSQSPEDISKKHKNDEQTNESREQLIQTMKIIKNKKEFIKEKFLVDMPEDFYLFWDFCKELNKENPKEAFKVIGLTLVGPFDVLDESFVEVDEAKDEKFYLHWRYYYDPPEFQTVIKGEDKTGYHIGYFRDSPDDLPLFLGYNEANKNCTINQIGENLFGAVNAYLEKVTRTIDPFKKMSVMKIQKGLCAAAKKHNLNLNNHGRRRKTVCKTFNGVGVVVPYNSSTQVGYRKLPVDEKELRKILTNVSNAYPEKKDKAFTPLQFVLTAATIANDECDFGTALELGIDIFCFGHVCFNTVILNMLKITYELLNRQAFGDILEEHLKIRKKDGPFVLKLKQ